MAACVTLIDPSRADVVTSRDDVVPSEAGNLEIVTDVEPVSCSIFFAEEEIVYHDN